MDLLLLDVVMPELGGWEVWERLRGQGTRSRLILMTGYSPETVESRFVTGNRALTKSGAAVLEKPYDIDDLGRKVREVLDAAV